MSKNFSDIVASQEKASKPPPRALGINVEKPKFPQYAVYSKRLDSFESWSEYLPVAKEDLVEAGFVYTGVGDSVRCYFCGGGLRNWDRGDVPMEEHAKWYPKCPHMLLVKGQAYVDKMIRGEQPEEGASLQTDSAEARPNHIETVAALSCIEMGYNPVLVQRAIDIFIERHNGKSDFKGRTLAEILIDMEDEDNFATPCDNDNEVDSRQTVEQDLDEEPEQLESLKEENLRLKENQMCKICLDRKADIIFLPCGHLVSCPQCALAMSKCIICQKTVNGQIKTFFVNTSNVL